MPESKQFYEFIADADAAGERLDKFLSRVLPDFSRSRLKQIIEGGHVLLNGVAAMDASRKLKSAERVELRVPEAAPSVLVAEAIPLNVVYEDTDILILNKPAGMTVHPAAGNYEHTLVHALLAHCGDSLSGIGGVQRPGIVHRIDKDTSGLLVVAKHDSAHAHLSQQLAARTLKRTYLTIVWGAPYPASGSIDGNIGRSTTNRKKMAVLKQGGKSARTHYETKQVFEAAGKVCASLLECRLETGRTHQIRVHLTHKGHPLVGDPVYGGSSSARLATLKQDKFKEPVDNIRKFSRQALHAAALELLHPVTGVKIQVTAPLPEDMQELIECFKDLNF